MKLYITGMSLFVLAVFYLPLVLWVLWKILKHPLSGVKKAGLTALTLMLAYAIPLGDVTVNSIAMAKVCPSAGLHIYKTVKVDGFVGRYDVRDRPYRFIEFPTQRTDQTYYWKRFEKHPDGSISAIELAQPTAEYEVLFGEWRYDESRGVSVMRDVIRNRVSGDVLADRVLFNPLPGWLDRVLVYRWFGYGGRSGCHGMPSAGIDETKILIPTQSIN